MPPAPPPSDALPRCGTQAALTVADACQRYAIGRTRMFQLIKEGHVDGRKFGNRTLILTGSLDAFRKRRLGTLLPARALNVLGRL